MWDSLSNFKMLKLPKKTLSQFIFLFNVVFFMWRCGVWRLVRSSTRTGLWAAGSTAWTSPLWKQGNSTGSPWQHWTEQEWARLVTLTDSSSVRPAAVCIILFCASVNLCIILSCCSADTPFETHPETERQKKNVSGVLDLLQDPVLIGSIGAILWCVLMVAAVCIFRRHSSMDPLLARHGKVQGLTADTWSVSLLRIKKKGKNKINQLDCYS